MALTLTESLADEWMELEAEARQQTFFEYLPSTLEVWGVQGDEGWVMAVHDDNECLPLWTHERLANMWLAQHHPNATAAKISLHEFKHTWLPGLGKNGVTVLVSPSDRRDDLLAMSAEEFTNALS